MALSLAKSDESNSAVGSVAAVAVAAAAMVQIRSDLATNPLLALGAMVPGENASLPWFLRAEAVAALSHGNGDTAGNHDDERDTTTHDDATDDWRGSGGRAGGGTGTDTSGFDIKAAVRQFFVGGKGGGAPAHPHSHAVNSLAYGMKRWRMWQPADSYFAAKSHPGGDGTVSLLTSSSPHPHLKILSRSSPHPHLILTSS